MLLHNVILIVRRIWYNKWLSSRLSGHGPFLDSSYRHKCKLCKIRFVEKNGLRRHMEVISRSQSYLFKHVFFRKEFSKYRYYLQRAHAANGDFKCDKCSCTFLNNFGLAAHKRVYHNSSVIGVANITNFIRRGNTNSTAPVAPVKLGKPIKKSKITSDKSSYAGSHKLKCTLCDLRFSKPDRLKWHLKVILIITVI